MASIRRFLTWRTACLVFGGNLLALWGLSLPFGAVRAADTPSLKELADRIRDLEAKLACMSKEGDAVLFDGCNVYIRSGSGQTEGAVNGLGNLIIGYNEASGDNIQRTGSHNLVIGPDHAYASFGGLVAGRENTLAAPYASITGGRLNTVNAPVASVHGGSANVASKELAVVMGGRSNRAQGLAATISGGTNNLAEGDFASVSGGTENMASGFAASVSGGTNNSASGNNASISGGRRRTAPGQDNWRAGNIAETN
ncbi:MAG: hypothetical protein AB7N91_11325 [Candidatus Tectimicrobiota bacterium]